MRRYYRQCGWALLIGVAALAGFQTVGHLTEVATRSPTDFQSGCTQALLDRETGHTVLGSCPNTVTLTAELRRPQ
jgi:hypothetical protein